MDNKSMELGAKRNAMIKLAQGQFIVFVDDDDDVSGDHIDTLLNAIQANRDADCITFNACVSVNSAPPQLCRYALYISGAGN
jgi:glycosyltransferase involved in cell wall biosynthesis